RTQRQLERDAPRADRGRAGDADQPRQLALEALDLGSLRHVAAAHDARNTLRIVVSERRPRVGNDHDRSVWACRSRLVFVVAGSVRPAWTVGGLRQTGSGSDTPDLTRVFTNSAGAGRTGTPPRI